MSVIKWQVLQWAGRMVKYATLSRLSDRFGFGYVDSPPIDPEAGEERTQQRVRILQWFGFRSRPKVAGGECIVVAPRGGSTNAVAVAADNLGVGPTDLLEGESVMYGSGGSTLKHDQAGKVTVNSSTTQDVVVNGGSLKVARSTDLCEILPAGPMALWMQQVESVINTVTAGAVNPLSNTFVGAPGIRIASTQGAPRFKA